jgi:O-antigen ligase
MQLIYAFLHEYFIDKKTFSVPGSFCWANTNHIASLILIAVPVCCYLISRAKNIFPLLIQLVFLYVACFVSQSDGGLATLLIFTPFLIYKTQVSVLQKNREAFKLFWISIIFICAIVALAFFTFNYSDSIAFVDKMTSDSGRAPIYDKAWNLFTQYPIFGVGLGYSAFSALSEYSGFFHSTFFQTIASAGIIGFISCVFLYFARIRSLTKNASELCSFFLVSFIMHACYALIDNGEFNIVLMYFTAMFSFVLTQTKRAEMDKSLPVCKIFKSLS